MPTALQIGPYRIYFYSYDCSEPRHMHVDRDNSSAKFWLDPDIALVHNHGYRRKEVRDIVCMKIWRFCEMNGTPFAATALKLARIADVHVTDDTLSVDLEDGRTISVPIGWYPRLAYGTSDEQANWRISGAGYGIHWPDLDEDLGVEGILLGKQSTESSTSFERWLQRRTQTELQPIP